MKESGSRGEREIRYAEIQASKLELSIAVLMIIFATAVDPSIHDVIRPLIHYAVEHSTLMRTLPTVQLHRHTHC